MGLTVAVTGPTGEIGISTVDALERDAAVDRVIGMARRPFDPDAHGWTKLAATAARDRLDDHMGGGRNASPTVRPWRWCNAA